MGSVVETLAAVVLGERDSDDRDERAHSDEHRHARVLVAVGDDRRRDERHGAARDRGAHLVAEGGAGVAHVGRERLGEERAENRAIARPDDRETDHHRDQQPREGLLVHHPEEGEGVQGHRDGAADEHLLAPDPIRQATPEEHRRDREHGRDEHGVERLDTVVAEGVHRVRDREGGEQEEGRGLDELREEHLAPDRERRRAGRGRRALPPKVEGRDTLRLPSSIGRRPRRTPPNPASCTTPTDRWPPPSACRYPSPAGGRSPSSTGSSWPGREPPSSRESSATASRHPARRRRATAERARLVAMSTELLDLARTIALEAGRLAARRRREGVEVAATKSSIVDVVTAADREVEELIRARIEAARPHDAILGEEGGATGGSSGVTWVVDPIDGTVNYLYGVPHYAISIAVVEGDPDPAGWTSLAGVVVNPAIDEVY